MSFEEEFNAKMKAQHQEQERLRNTFKYVTYENPHQREIFMRNGRYEMCDIIGAEIDCTKYPSLGSFMVCKDPHGREFFASPYMGTWAELRREYSSISHKDVYIERNEGKNYVGL
jgi:putative hemolysin